MKYIVFFNLLLLSNFLFGLEQVAPNKLQGKWTAFYISQDSFSPSKEVATTQTLEFKDNENVILRIFAREIDYFQDTVYNLKYTLTLKDNVPYLTLYTDESKEVLGAYIRIPVLATLELASDPIFTKQKQLYRQNSEIQSNNI